ncbi:hypothetical protein E2R55_20100 [Vibrio vulnificus]|nr:hypothetical protein E2R55_20100 [Vibrio vulnificus]
MSKSQAGEAGVLDQKGYGVRIKGSVVLVYTDETSLRLKKFGTLLPNNWLAETPQPLAVRRLGRQSAERERISEINWDFN